MKAAHWVQSGLVVAVVASLGMSVLPHRGVERVAAASLTTASLGACWLESLGLGGGHDPNAVNRAGWWQAGTTQTVVQGVAPQALYWSLTLYHLRHGKIVSFYDRQLTPSGSGSFTLTIGGARPKKGLWVDPTADGGDAMGYLIYRAYKPAAAPSLPTVSYSSKGALPAMLSSCSALTSSVRATAAAALKKNPIKTAVSNTVWAGSASPFRSWSKPINPLLTVSPADVSRATLATQLSDPNDVFRAVLFNISSNNLVLHGTLPHISPQAPISGMRYFSLCIYPTDRGFQNTVALACLDNTTIKTGANGDYTVVVAASTPSTLPKANLLSPGSQTQVGLLVMRWLLPSQGPTTTACQPALATDGTLPSLPVGC